MTLTRRTHVARILGPALVSALMATTALTSVAQANAAQTANEPVVTQSNLPASFSKLVADTRPAVVSVLVKRGTAKQNVTNSQQIPEHFKEFFKRFQMPGGSSPRFGMPGAPNNHPVIGQGSGFFISKDGYIVTNNHVVDGAKDINVRLHDGTTLEAKLIGTDAKTDLAVLKVDGSNFTHVKFGDSDTAKVGDWVVAVGNPFGLSGTATAGIVSARGRDIGSGPYDDFIQIDASINKGNSGGPAFNRRGEVIGVNTAIFSPTGGNVGIGFAVPANIANDVVDSLITHGTVKRGWLGVVIQPISEDLADAFGLKNRDGALISSVSDNSPASKAGLKSGDVVMSFGEEPIKTPRDLSKAVAGTNPNERVQVNVMRDGKRLAFDIAVDELETKQTAMTTQPEGKDKPKLGLMLKNTDQGVVITGVAPGSPAAEKNIQSGDMIAEVGGRKVKSIEEIKKEIAKTQQGSILMLVKNKHGSRYVALKAKPVKSMG